MRHLENLVGRKFGRLTVIKLDRKTNRSRIWACLCECGNTTYVQTAILKGGHTKSCGCLRIDKLISQNKSRALPRGEAAFNAAFDKYKDGALRRGLRFEISKSDFREIASQDCCYCGARSTKIISTGGGSYRFTGVDRVDNSLGYIPGNLAPCCTTCNKAKRKMDIDQFMDWIWSIYHYSIAQDAVLHACELSDSDSVALHNLYLKYLDRARRGRLEFEISEDEFEELTHGRCFYCGVKPEQISKAHRHRYIYNGIDRLHSGVGYMLGNCVTCCKHCNKAKLQMSYYEFIKWVERVYRNFFFDAESQQCD